MSDARGSDTELPVPPCWKSPMRGEAKGHLCPPASDLWHLTSRKEVIQPQVPLRLPCYDFTPVADLTVVGCLPPSFLGGLARRLRVKPTPMV
jgi:hypothetical protein